MNTSTSNRPHWQDRHRFVSNGRMVWYGDSGNEQYWYEYWKARLTPDYYASAEANDLTSDQLGKVLFCALLRTITRAQKSAVSL